MKIRLSSKAPATARAALENLLFFNPGQEQVAPSIMRSVERFGSPRIVETRDGLTIQLGGQDVHALFVFDCEQEGKEPLAVAIYTRTNIEEISVAHVAVHPDYCLRSRKAGLGLGALLLRRIRRHAARTAGVRRLALSYGERTLPVTRITAQADFARAV